MIIDCIADLHGHYPELEGGDLLIVAGDLTARDTLDEQGRFMGWLYNQDYRKKVFIAGNHDNILRNTNPFGLNDKLPIGDAWTDINYLCDSGVEFEGLKIWGTPWTAYFKEMNPECMAFTLNYGCDTDDWLAEKWALIPDDIDILITHGPPYGILDLTDEGRCVGSKSLQMELFRRLRPKLLVCGHIHEAYGIEPPGGIVERAVNCSHVNEDYKPVNKPIRVIL